MSLLKVMTLNIGNPSLQRVQKQIDWLETRDEDVFVLTETKLSQGCVTPEGAQEVVQCKPDWSEFVEACFTPGSELNRRLKQMILNMGEEEKHK